MAQNIHENKSGFIPKLIAFIFITFITILFSIIGIMIYVSLVLTTIPTSEVINKDDATLTLGEVWTVDEQFSIWIDSIEEIPAETAQNLYPELTSGTRQALSTITDTEGKRYFDITFSFENINFEGCYYKDELEYDYLNVRTWAYALDENQKKIFPSPLKFYEQHNYYTTLQKVPVTPGITSTDNHLIIEIDTTSDNKIQPDFFEINFIVPTEILSGEASNRYLRKYIIPIS